MILTVHDELVFEVPTGEEDAAERLVEREMTSVAEMKVPLRVEASFGPNWAESQELDTAEPHTAADLKPRFVSRTVGVYPLRRFRPRMEAGVQEVKRGETYRTLEEQEGRLSPAEERFERGRRTVGLFVGPAVLLITLALPLDLEPAQQTLAAIFLFVIVFWITEAIPIPVTAVLGLCLCVALGVADGDTVFAAFASSTIFLFIGGFIIAEAMMVHGLDRRFAFRVRSARGVAQSTHRTIIAFGVIAVLISGFISNTAATAMIFPIGLGVMGALSGLIDQQSEGQTNPDRLRFGTALMLMIAYGASVGGLLTPIGSPPNLIGRAFIQEQTDTTISFFDWMMMAAPIVAVMFVALCFILIKMNKPEVRELSGAEDYIEEERKKLGRFSPGERNTLIAFAVAVTFWILPGVVALVAGDTSSAYETVLGRLDEGAVAILAASLLFFLPVDWKQRKFTLTWNQAAGSTGAPSSCSVPALRWERCCRTRGSPGASAMRSPRPWGSRARSASPSSRS